MTPKLAVLLVLCFITSQMVAAKPNGSVAPTGDDATKGLDQFFGQMQNLLKDTFNEAQLQKLGNELKTFGEQFAAKGKELLDQADAGMKKIQNK